MKGTFENKAVGRMAVLKFNNRKLLVVGGITVFLTAITAAASYYPKLPLIIAAPVIALIGLISVVHPVIFPLFIFPSIFAIIVNKFMLVMTLVLCANFFMNKLLNYNLSVKIPYPALIALIIITSLQGLFTSINFSAAKYFYVYAEVVPWVIFIILYNILNREQDIYRFVLIVSIISCIIGWITLSQYLQSGMLRMVFAWPNHNRLSGFFGLILPLSFVFALKLKNTNEKIIWWFILFGLTAGIFVAQTRGIMFSTIFAVIYISWSLKNWKPVFLLGAVTLAAFIISPELITSRIQSLLSGKETDVSVLGRLQIWMLSLDLLPENFLFGLGLASFPVVCNLKYGLEIPGGHPHNIYLEWIFNYGIIGLVSRLLLIVLVLRKSVIAAAKSLKEKVDPDFKTLLLIGLNAGIISLLVGDLVDDYIAVPAISAMFLIIIGFQMHLTNQINHRQEVEG